MKQLRKVSIGLVIVLLISMNIGVSIAGIPIQPSPEDPNEYMEFLMNYILENFKGEVTEEELYEGAYKGIFDQLDDHSIYMNTKEYEDFNASSSGEFGGIGITVTKEGNYVKIISPIEGTPGDRADLKSGDFIIAVDGEDISGWTLHEAVEVMRGEPGDKVTLTINRRQKIFEVEIIREIIKVDPVSYEMKGDIGYIRLKQFNQFAYDKTEEALFALKQENPKALIIDLRSNPGGYLSEVINIADLFIDKESPIVHIDYKTEEDQTYYAKNRDLFEKEIIVLVNEGSASASEILTGAIKDNKEGTIVGTKTFGKGTVQTVLPLANDGAMKLTIAEYLTANKSHINKKGITPDILVEIPEMNGEVELAPIIEDKVYSYYSKGLNVYAAQQRLSYLGYDLAIDGRFGPETLKTIKQFQRDYKLDITGTLDDKTITALKQAIEEGPRDIQLEKALEILQ